MVGISKRARAAVAYLAGPDVFYPDARERGEAKKALLASVGITGLYPLDNDIAASLIKADPKAAAMAIGRGNEAMMRRCAAPQTIGFILANMEPWHGPSMDVGTAFEIGYMSALAEASNGTVKIIGYSPDRRLFADRVQEMHFRKAGCAVLKDGALIGPDGMVIEDFGLADNLMLIQAIEKTGGVLCATFEEAAKFAAALAEI
jgi:nucleoside 2-deoxyribosyltransferase